LALGEIILGRAPVPLVLFQKPEVGVPGVRVLFSADRHVLVMIPFLVSLVAITVEFSAPNAELDLMSCEKDAEETKLVCGTAVAKMRMSRIENAAPNARNL